MIGPLFRPSLRYHLVFYAGGLLFATVSYIAGVWALGAESASWKSLPFQRALLECMVEGFGYHTLTYITWVAVCLCAAGVIAYLFDREVYYRRKAEQKANADGLTDVYNHRYFQERLGAELERASRYERVLSIIMLDLDNFKSFNDTWGHQEGDNLLKWFARLCSGCVRNIDILARYGGEEFVIVLPETGSKEAMAVAERIRTATEKRSAAEFGKDKRVTVSAGVATYPRHGATRHVLILNADAALYFAKQEGKNRCFTYEQRCHRSYRANTEHVRALLSNDDVEAMEALGAAADARDSHTRGHSMSVMRMSVALGEKLGMSPEEVDNLRAAALLHDLGKIATPEEILGKSGPLQAEEWKLVENHAGLGSQLLRRMQQMNSIVPGVKHHHERFDGRGYPAGLTGKDIPLLARIIAIADAYDAMTNARSYKSEPMSPQEAVVELRRCAGSQFDPELVEMFISMAGYDKAGEEAA